MNVIEWLLEGDESVSFLTKKHLLNGKPEAKKFRVY